MAVAKRVFDLQGHSRLCSVSLCLSLLFCFVSQANELVNLNLHDEVYTFVKRLEARNLVEKELVTTQPLTRREIAEMLIEVSEKYQSGQIELTSVEEKHLKRYQWLFGDEIVSDRRVRGIQEAGKDARAPSGRQVQEIPMKKRHLVTIEHENYRMDFDLKVKDEIAHIRSRVAESEEAENGNKSISSLSLIMRGKLGKGIGVSSILHPRLLLGTADYNPYRAEKAAKFMVEESEAISSMEGYIVLALPWMNIQWGTDENWWGPGWHGALMISDNPAPQDILKISGLYGPVKFTYFTAILRENTPKYQPKYMSAHRVEFLPYRGINIGLSEVMVFADRYKPRYLNPFTVFYTLGGESEEDNGVLGLDFDITLLPSIEFYGELMVDDLQTAEGLDTLRVWNSKYGILVGGYWVDLFGLRDTDVRIEYAFANQYAYTHGYDMARYTHRGLVIGHWMGTDADDLWLNMKHWFTDKLRGSLTYERERQGEGDVEKKHMGAREEYWEFLSGVPEATHSFSVGLSYIGIGRYSAGAEYTHSRVRNADHKLGVNGKEHRFIMKAEYRF